MVKIKAKSLFIGLIMLVFLMSAAYATRPALDFSDVDVRVAGRSDNGLSDGETISREAEPGDSVEFRVEVRNNYTRDENLDIENIQVKVTIEGIDDGDDLEEEASDFDLRPGSDKRITLKFQIPLEVEEDDFDVLIEADGEDENNTDQSIQMRLKLEVDKESHRIILTRNTLSPSEVACNRRNVQVGVSLLNIGTEDEDDVRVHILNADLELDIQEDISELEAEPFEDTSKFSRTYSFNVPAGLEPGSYPVIIRALYDDDRRKAEETVTLTVNDCGTARTDTGTTIGGTQEKEETESTQSGVSEEKTTTVVVQQVPPETTITQEGAFSGNGFIIAVIVAEVIAVVVGIILLVTLFARRE